MMKSDRPVNNKYVATTRVNFPLVVKTLAITHPPPLQILVTRTIRPIKECRSLVQTIQETKNTFERKRGRKHHRLGESEIRNFPFKG